jgi:hypothetical protein
MTCPITYDYRLTTFEHTPLRLTSPETTWNFINNQVNLAARPFLNPAKYCLGGKMKKKIMSVEILVIHAIIGGI